MTTTIDSPFDQLAQDQPVVKQHTPDSVTASDTLPTTYGTYYIPGLDCLAYYDPMGQLWVREDTGEWLKNDYLLGFVQQNGYTKLPDTTPAFREGRWHKH